ncbi:MATE family efflux transporter [Lacrimispora saccharolytica]|nr:MATE family efflux transporter [Lacrimispora saccharolytica]
MFAAPILLSQILQQMYSIADCMIVGHFGGGNGLAAAGEAALFLSVIINFFVGFST